MNPVGIECHADNIASFAINWFNLFPTLRVVGDKSEYGSIVREHHEKRIGGGGDQEQKQVDDKLKKKRRPYYTPLGIPNNIERRWQRALSGDCLVLHCAPLLRTISWVIGARISSRTLRNGGFSLTPSLICQRMAIFSWTSLFNGVMYP